MVEFLTIHTTLLFGVGDVDVRMYSCASNYWLQSFCYAILADRQSPTFRPHMNQKVYIKHLLSYSSFI